MGHKLTELRAFQGLSDVSCFVATMVDGMQLSPKYEAITY